MANKRLGQHFLQNGTKLQKIADALHIQKGDLVVEIGPGRGELTEKLIAAGAQVIAIEKDRALAAALSLNYSDARIRIGDAREELPKLVQELGKKDYLLAGNIPYYLTGYLFRMVGELAHKPRRAVFTIQKEVAERIAFAHGMRGNGGKLSPPRMNILAASILWWADPEFVTVVPRKMFAPPPRVDSAVIALQVRDTAPAGNYAGYMEFVKILFSHPKKFALSNLSASYSKAFLAENFFHLGLSEKVRPADIPFAMLLQLYACLEVR